MEELPEYPKQLPVPLREGYGLQHVDPMIRTQLASGRARQRRRFTSVPTEVTVSWLMTAPQAQLFEAWYRDVIDDGVAWFACALRTPIGLQRYEARFTGIYSGPDLVGVDSWRFTAELELKSRPILPRGSVQFPQEIIYSRLFDRTMNHHWPDA